MPRSPTDVNTRDRSQGRPDLRLRLLAQPFADVHPVNREAGQDLCLALLVGQQLAQRGEVTLLIRRPRRVPVLVDRLWNGSGWRSGRPRSALRPRRGPRHGSRLPPQPRTCTRLRLRTWSWSWPGSPLPLPPRPRFPTRPRSRVWRGLRSWTSLWGRRCHGRLVRLRIWWRVCSSWVRMSSPRGSWRRPALAASRTSPRSRWPCWRPTRRPGRGFRSRTRARPPEAGYYPASGGRAAVDVRLTGAGGPTARGARLVGGCRCSAGSVARGTGTGPAPVCAGRPCVRHSRCNAVLLCP
ncbi:hypothetical protein KPP03845_200299 (plasmid) [Streptomyces xanthophaeus]|nr:hypothetical protein KPP03845_200299 [Streptomyces xanthophaeus]